MNNYLQIKGEAVTDNEEGGTIMNSYDSYPESEFEPFEYSKKGKKKSKKKKKFLKRIKKFFKRFRNRAIDVILSTMSQMALRFFDRKLEKAFA